MTPQEIKLNNRNRIIKNTGCERRDTELGLRRLVRMRTMNM